MIVFERISWKNLLSTGTYPTVIDLTKVSKTVIRGKNGSGKSTLLDALTFVLFNRPFRKINKPQLISTTNQKDLVVELDFSIASTKYKIIRGMKPDIFEVYRNGTLINQNAENKDYQATLETSILKMNIKSFLQIVVLGSASYTPFMQLTTGERRKIIEDLLDIQVFSVMNDLLKKRIDKNKEAIQTLKYEMDLLETKIESTKKYNETIRVLHADELANIKDKIAVYEADIQSSSEMIQDFMDRVEVLQKKEESIQFSKPKLDKLIQIESSLKTRIKTLEKEISFYTSNDNCPTCKQTIDSTFRAEEITTRNDKVSEIVSNFERLEREIEASKQAMREVSDIQGQIQKINLDIAKENAKISMLRKSADGSRKELEKALTKHKEADITDIAVMYKELSDKQDIQTKNFDQRDIHSIASQLLKDGGIKSAIIKQYIPVINSLVNKYLEKLEFFVKFELDEEFRETIKSRHKDAFSYFSFSEGEKARIDLSLLLTWREVSRLRSGVATNLLIMDEVFDGSLEDHGVDMLLDIFDEMGEDTNIFVISHKNDQMGERFDRTIHFEKKKGFSQIVGMHDN